MDDILEEQRVDNEQSVTLWLVEDHEQYRSIIARLINESETIRCERSFTRCEEMLESLAAEYAPEVVLMDIGLPGMDGIEGVRRMKSLSPSTEAIILTVHDDDEKVFRAICAGASGYLLKDSSAETILSGIQEVLHGGAAMNSQIARRVLEMFGKLSVPQANYGLTNREKEILQLLVEGLTKRQIADKLFLSYFTVDTHLKNIYAKLQVHTRTGAVAKVLKERLV